MSLAALNYPPLVATVGLSLGAGTSIIQSFINSSSWNLVRTITLFSYGLNVLSVSRPGRLDGEAAGDGELSPRNGRTLVAPAGWAFAIWGPIFLGELVNVSFQFFIAKDQQIATILRKIAAPFLQAQLFQTLWCASFRSKYKGPWMFLSSGFLVATAASLSKAHAIFTSHRDTYSFGQYLTFFFPMALHFGWVTAASLVNLNGAVSMNEKASEKLIAFTGHVSVIAASALGVVLSLKRDAPVFGAVIAWALTAVSDSMKQRIAESEKKDGKVVSGKGLFGAKTQKILSSTGALISGAASIFTLGSLAFTSKMTKSMPTP